MTPAAAAAPHSTPRPICRISRNSQKRRKTQKYIYYVNGGTQERKCDFIKIFFHLYVNGGTQERKCDFIKIFFHLYVNGNTQERR